MTDDIDQGGPSAEYVAHAEHRAEEVQMTKDMDRELRRARPRR
jgi:hypothetical protein